MSIEKMVLVNLRGDRKDLDESLWRCTSSGIFHPEQAPSIVHSKSAKAREDGAEEAEDQRDSSSETCDFDYTANIKEENPYVSHLKNLEQLADSAGIPLEYADFESLDITADRIPAYLDELSKRVARLSSKKQGIERIIPMHEQALVHMSHLRNFECTFDDLFACEYIKVRFGRMPNESYNKLRYYDDKPFVFVAFDQDKDYCWCLYLTDRGSSREIDSLFQSLFFERLRVPDYAHGTPEKAEDIIRADVDKERVRLKEINIELENIQKVEGQKLRMIYSKLRLLSDAFEMRRYTAIVKKEFVLTGFIPKKDQDTFQKLFHGLTVSINCLPAGEDVRFQPPVRLKNNWFVRPFEMFVEMYGLPSYRDIDPTPFVAISYTLLFGMMFGDFGQGLVIMLLGFFLGAKKKMALGNVMARIGMSSCLFGFLYGSVFGFEHVFDPMWSALGFNFPHGKPIEVMASEVTNTVLMVSIGLGAVIILLAIVMNIILGVKNKNIERAVFSNNGLAGLVFYVAAIYAAVSSLMLKKSVLTPAYIIAFIALPLVIMFLKEPLGRLAAGKKDLFHDGVGGFIVESFFEMFEVLLSFITNTMSFLRVGGFILSHAGMMAVVMTLSDMISGGGVSIPVIIIGNLFVMGMEGLIVGIQALRLEFYEIFSRFFDGEGKPFEPVTVNYDLTRS